MPTEENSDTFSIMFGPSYENQMHLQLKYLQYLFMNNQVNDRPVLSVKIQAGEKRL